MYIDADGWLVPDKSDDPGVIRVPTVRTTRLDVEHPLGIVWHTTDDIPSQHYAEKIANKWQTYDKAVDRAASAHLVFDLNERIWQLAPFTVGTWHCGTSGELGGATRKINKCSIGIEVVNGGRLKNVNGQWRIYPYTDPKRFVAPDLAVRVPDAGYWCGFTTGQEKCAVRVLQACRAKWNWPAADCMRTHAEYDPSRREDPGLLWTTVIMPRVMRDVLGIDETLNA